MRACGQGKEQAMWEIIADPKEYGIGILEEGINNHRLFFPEEDRKRWAEEIDTFAAKLGGLAERAKNFQKVLAGQEEIVATPSSLKTLKVMLFKINDAMTTAMDLADSIESQIVKK
jgi:hypothetical protein